MSSLTEVEKELQSIFEISGPHYAKTVENLIEEIYEKYKVFVEYDLLVTALKNLIKKGIIKELSPLIYYKSEGKGDLSKFSGIMEEEFNQAKRIVGGFRVMDGTLEFDEGDYDDDLTVQDFEKYIIWVLKKSTPDNPASLEDIIFGIDAKQRVLVMYDELIPALNNLFNKGFIEELKHLVYYKSENQKTTTKFSGFSEFEFETAVKSYSDKVAKIFEEVMDEDDDRVRKMSIEWFIPEGTLNDHYEEIMDSFTDNLEDELRESSLEVYGYEMGYEEDHNSIGIWIDGDLEDIETDELYDQIIPFINKFKKEQSGEISLTKHYVDKEDEILEI